MYIYITHMYTYISSNKIRINIQNDIMKCLVMFVYPYLTIGQIPNDRHPIRKPT